jgi:SHS2 domain-containing protein
MHEIFEHTADLGLRIRAASLTDLFAEAGEALFGLIIENPDAVQPKQSHTIELTNPQRDLLFFDWLNELIYLYDAKHVVLGRFDVSVEGDRLRATVYGEPRDEARHHLDHEVKAITYHHLKVEEQPDHTWLAEVIVDI